MGNDSNDCQSPSTPCATINGALNNPVFLGGDTILVASGTYTGINTEVVLLNRDVTLSGGWDESFTSQNGISILDGQGVQRGIRETAGVTALVERFQLQNGNVSGNGGGILNSGNLTLVDSAVRDTSAGNGAGSAIYNTTSGSLTLNNSIVSNNGNSQICFVIVNEGTFTANNSVVEGNTTTRIYCVAAIIINYSGAMTFNQTSIRNNPIGGGIYNYASLTLENSVISGNVGSDGPGGIYNWGGVLTVNNTTISGNTTSNGGGIFAGGGGIVRLNNSTISNNSAGTGGGIYNYPNVPADIMLQNTILAGNMASNGGPDCNGNVIGSAGYNLVGDITFCNFAITTSDMTNLNPALGPLQDNGGPTFTHALLPQSAAIDAGNGSGCTDQNGNPLNTDQRGVSRPQGIACDIGAYEYPFSTPGPAVSLAIVSGNDQETLLNSAFPKPLRVTALDSQGNRVSGVPITFTAPASGASGTFANTSTNTTIVNTDVGGVATTSIFTANDQAGVYVVSASAADIGTVNFTLRQAFHPANDNFSNAESVSLPFHATTDITDATSEQGEPQYCYTMSNTVWYSFTPAGDTLIQLDTQGSPINNNLNIYHAVAPGINGLQHVFCMVTNQNPSYTFLAQGGQTYYFQVGGLNGEVGMVNVNLTQIPPPPNDNFESAASINSLPSTMDFDNEVATFQNGEPNPSCAYPAPPYKTAWFAYTAQQNGTLSANLGSFNFSPFMAIYQGTSINNLIQLGCAQFSDKVTISVTSGQTYYFQVGGLDGRGGTGQFFLETTPPPQANFYYYPNDPSKFDTVQFNDGSYDPGNVGFQTYTWDFGDGIVASGYSATHKYTTDGNYQVTHTVTTTDGRTASITQTVQVRTHDVAITKLTSPNSANVGQTKTITVALRNVAYPETVQIDLYKSTPNGFVWIASVTKSVPALSGNRTTAVDFSYKFITDDARLGKVTFKAVATLVGARDAYPSDNEAVSSITKVSK
jgi:PKD repeat protein